MQSETIAAARVLCQKLRAVHDDPQYRNVWATAQNHTGSQYAGLTYTEELAALESILAAPSAPPSSSLARRIAEKINDYYVESILNGRSGKHAKTADEEIVEVAAIIESELAATSSINTDPKVRASSFKTFLAEQMKDQEFAEAYEEISAKENELLEQIFAAEREAATSRETESHNDKYFEVIGESGVISLCSGDQETLLHELYQLGTKHVLAFGEISEEDFNRYGDDDWTEPISTVRWQPTVKTLVHLSPLLSPPESRKS